jgi:hypothetical protein
MTAFTTTIAIGTVLVVAYKLNHVHAAKLKQEQKEERAKAKRAKRAVRNMALRKEKAIEEKSWQREKTLRRWEAMDRRLLPDGMLEGAWGVKDDTASNRTISPCPDSPILSPIVLSPQTSTGSSEDSDGDSVFD